MEVTAAALRRCCSTGRVGFCICNFGCVCESLIDNPQLEHYTSRGCSILVVRSMALSKQVWVHKFVGLCCEFLFSLHLISKRGTIRFVNFLWMVLYEFSYMRILVEDIQVLLMLLNSLRGGSVDRASAGVRTSSRLIALKTSRIPRYFSSCFHHTYLFENLVWQILPSLV